jgi:hypothetical protein
MQGAEGPGDGIGYGYRNHSSSKQQQGQDLTPRIAGRDGNAPQSRSLDSRPQGLERGDYRGQRPRQEAVPQSLHSQFEGEECGTEQLDSLYTSQKQHSSHKAQQEQVIRPNQQAGSATGTGSYMSMGDYGSSPGGGLPFYLSGTNTAGKQM